MGIYTRALVIEVCGWASENDDDEKSTRPGNKWDFNRV